MSRVPVESLEPHELAEQQGQRLQRLLTTIRGKNAFYTRKFDAAGIDVERLRLPADLSKLPLTTKSELIADQAACPPWGTALTEPLERYTRYCQTSSTSGQPLRWIDTNESWQWMLDCWKVVYRAAGVVPHDRIFFPFSFGPFLGFWTGFEAGCQMGFHCVPGGGMSSQLRLATIESIGATVVCCTPTYALRLAEVADAERPERPLAQSAVRLLIVAGEPGGSIPATRARIERAWGARVIDHHGLTEVGPMSFECFEAPGFLHVTEDAYICEVLPPATAAATDSDRAVPDGECGELVVTNLGRTASPVIRYRTGDLVIRRTGTCACGRTWSRLEGGVLGRADDMVNIRGVNVYPASIESVVRRFPEVAEFRSTVSWSGAMRSLAVDIEAVRGVLSAERGGTEPSSGLEARVSHELRVALGLTIPVRLVDEGTLPRFEMKARRFVLEETS